MICHEITVYFEFRDLPWKTYPFSPSLLIYLRTERLRKRSKRFSRQRNNQPQNLAKRDRIGTFLWIIWSEENLNENFENALDDCKYIRNGCNYTNSLLEPTRSQTRGGLNAHTCFKTFWGTLPAPSKTGQILCWKRCEAVCCAESGGNNENAYTPTTHAHTHMLHCPSNYEGEASPTSQVLHYMDVFISYDQLSIANICALHSAEIRWISYWRLIEFQRGKAG